jgi:hypothetical protein
MKVSISFLTIDGAYAADLPAELDPAPDARAAWSYQGDRWVTFAPDTRFDPARELEEFKPLFDLERDGIRVSVYERTYDPPLLSALWGLPTGYLGTFVADPLPATAEAMTTVINAIAVESVGQGAVPQVAFASPLSRSNPEDSDLANSLTFMPADTSRSWPYIKFAEAPGATAADMGVRTEATSQTVSASNLAAPGLVVSCAGPQESRQQIVDLSAQVAGSVEPLAGAA